ncbi:helix-turn-helix transcriptional regulator [Denitrovibrio acetiphilus]|nr:WYL domain-containing protein [Denitrovibrio acetiphilus]
MVADELGVSLRTAQRYLSDMSYLPGVCYSDEKHQWYLTEHYGLHESYLKQDELAVLSGLFDYAENILQDEYSGMLTKLRKKIISASNRQNIIQFMKADSVGFDKVAENFTLLENYILKKQVITFDYLKNDKTYEVKPYRLIYNDGFWYLAALNKQDSLRKFGLDLMENIKSSNETFEIATDVIDAEISQANNIFFDPHKKIKVKCLLKSPMAGYIKRKEFFPFQQILEENDNGDITIEFQAGSLIESAKLCLQWLPYIKINSPEAVKNYFADLLRNSLDLQEK